MARPTESAEPSAAGAEDWLLPRMASLGALHPADRIVWIESVDSILSAERSHLQRLSDGAEAYTALLFGAQVSIIDAQLEWLKILAAQERKRQSQGETQQP